MVPVEVLTLIASPAPSPSVLVLKPDEKPVAPGKSRVVPIFVGAPEAVSLGMALENMRFARPTTHDLFLDTITNLDATIDHVLINRVKGKMFFSKLVLSQHGRLIEVDARPSDAIALAVREDAPLFIDEDVLDTASYPYLYRTPFDEKQQLAEFHSFLETLEPEDFREDSEQ
ncbi:MAG: bifunctional nuclease family protein [Eggerthellaceae bacterium]|jgi:bifunctional DNase/RNase